jgi:hypothetical protein
MRQFPIYSREYATTTKFINFWASQWSAKDKEQDEKRYTPYIGKPLTRENLLALFEWKNQMPLAQGKRRRVESFISRLKELEELPRQTSPKDFLETFKEGGAIWRIFLLHCWSGSKYPIYDQHVHRAMSFICGNQREEIGGWSDQEKIDAYLDGYIPFFNRFSVPNPQKVDQALLVFGRFIKNFQFLQEETSGMATDTREVIERFCGACQWLYESWQTRKLLFDQNPNQENLKRPHYEHFVLSLNVTLGQYCALQVAKLHDPAIQMGKKNLSVDYIIDHGDWDSATLQSLKSLRHKMSAFSDIMKIARNKIVAHNDLKVILREPVLGDFDPGADDEYFRCLKEFASLVRQKTIGDDFVYEKLFITDINGYILPIFNRGVLETYK